MLPVTLDRPEDGAARGERDASYSIGTIVAAHTVSARKTKKPIRCLKGNCDKKTSSGHTRYSILRR
jgi:hypothetical protein